MATVSVKPVRQYSDKGEEICPLCCEEPGAWSVGSCDHFVCLTCSARLRVLCNKKECPVCREKNDKVVVFQKPRTFSIPSHSLQDRKHGFIFSKSSLVNMYDAIRSYRCKICSKDSMTSMKQLSDHLRRDHNLLLCDICVEHLKLFPTEHKIYTRHELVRHRREGDPDDRSHKGHPQCKFCDERYYGKDELFFHLKENHFWCHFCENFGNQEYYPNYEMLKGHFRSDHYLCEEGQCRNEKFTNVFLSKLDFQAHKAKAHTKGMSKSEAKQLRHIDVGFTYTKKERDDGRQYHKHRHHLAPEREQPLEGSNETTRRDTDPSHQVRGHKTLLVKEGGGTVPAQQRHYKGDSEHKETSSTSSTTQTVANRRKPPGFDHVQLPVTLDKTDKVKNEEDEEATRDEWPSLDVESSNSTKPLVVVAGTTYDLPSRMLPPPGLSVPAIDSSKPSFEYNILEDAIRMLKNDPDKINCFKVISGQFQKGQITVNDYSDICMRLFGSTWQEFGVRLAASLPSIDKRHELLSKLIRTSSTATNHTGPPPGFTNVLGPTQRQSTSCNDITEISNGGKKSKKRNRKGGQNAVPNNKGVWSSGAGQGGGTSYSTQPPTVRHGSRSTSNMQLNKTEFPSLKDAVMMSDTPTGGLSVPTPWNMKVAAVK